MRSTIIRRAEQGLKFPGLYRPNNVPEWQRIHQAHDGLRQWEKGPRAKYMLYPYYALVAGTLVVSQYMLVRMVLGKRSLFGSK